jgi:hypothetical protein
MNASLSVYGCACPRANTTTHCAPGTPLTGSETSLFVVGAALGEMFVPLVIGWLLAHAPLSSFPIVLIVRLSVSRRVARTSHLPALCPPPPQTLFVITFAIYGAFIAASRLLQSARRSVGLPLSSSAVELVGFSLAGQQSDDGGGAAGVGVGVAAKDVDDR